VIQLSAEGSNTDNDFGANEWLVAEMYGQWKENPDSVDKSWWPILEKYNPIETAKAPEATHAAPAEKDPEAEKPAAAPAAAEPDTATRPIARTTKVEPKTQPIPAQAPPTGAIELPGVDQDLEPEVQILKGMPKAIAANMDSSLEVPTATSVRSVPAKLLIDNRIVINSHLARTRGGKVSFTHLIGYAIIKALKKMPSMNVFYDVIDGKPAMITPPHINFGLAIDIPKPDGSRALLVPNIKASEKLAFNEFLLAYEDLVKKARDNKLTAGDFAGTSVSLTNPGGIGTVHSVPRLTKGQGAIIGVGALEYPAEYQGLSEGQLARMGVGKIITLTSTYDHRVIQGAGSGEFLKIISDLLKGEDNFYQEVFADMRIPYEPVLWSQDFDPEDSDERPKSARIQELINAYRVRGHLMADVEPLEYVQRSHPDLDVRTHGLSLWDLDRSFRTGGFGGRSKAKFREVLGILRDTYCRTVGVE
jgi:2-oxoglutarate dehydrogenase E1 component